MPMRILLSVSLLILLISGSVALAQQTARPAQPATAAEPAQAEVFSMAFDDGSYLGIFGEDVTAENMGQYQMREGRGVGVKQVADDSPAERAGLKKGDVILRFDGEPVTNMRKLMRLIGETVPDQTVRLTINRAGNEQEVAVKLGRREHQMPRAFAIPQLSDEQRRQLEDLGRRGGSFNMVIGAQRRIGVTTAELTTQLADYFGVPGGHGLLVTSVADNSPAARAGIKAGDVITAVDGSAVEDSMDLISAVNRQSSGDVTLTIIRERNQRTIKVTPEQRRAGDFELHEITPQVGQINIPPMNIQLPRVNFVSPQMNLHMPRIVIPPMPRIEMTVPRIMRLPGMGVM